MFKWRKQDEGKGPVRSLIFLDTETTGLDPSTHEVIELALIRLEVRETRWVAPLRDVWHTKIKPERIELAEEKALEVNGYKKRPEDWADAPTMREVGGEILRLTEGGVLVGHNVSYDEAMINANLKRAGFDKRVPYHKVDTVTLAYEHLVPLGLHNLKFDTIRGFLGWPKGGTHRAMRDTEDAERLFHLLNGGMRLRDQMKIILRNSWRPSVGW